MERTYNFPVWGTQGGGLVREVSSKPYRYIFVEKPDCPGLDIGDDMPEMWDLIPANRQAPQVIQDEQFSEPDDYVPTPKEALAADRAIDWYARKGPHVRKL